MVFIPQRNALLFRHIAVLCFLLTVLVLSALRLIGYPPDPYSAIGLILLMAALVALPAVISRLILLIGMRYSLEPEGALIARYGTRFERIPVEDVEEIRSGANIPTTLRDHAPGWWHSWSGRITVPDLQNPVDWLAPVCDSKLLLVMMKDRSLAISPADPTLFLSAFSEWSARIAIEKVEPVSVEPMPLLMDILDHAAATSLLGIGLVEMTGLGAFIIGIQPSLPASMAFKFSVAGTPIAPGNPFRLIILPIAGGLVWLVNAVVGWFGWKQNDWMAAYFLWGTAVLVGIGLWFATIVLVLNK